MKISHIKETCLYIINLESAITFYNEILEFPLYDYKEGRHAFFKIGDTMLLCFNPEHSKLKKSPPAHYAHGKQHIAFEVPLPGYQRTKNLLLSKGVVIIDETTWKNNLKSFYFQDPEGNVLEIVPSGIWEK